MFRLPRFPVPGAGLVVHSRERKGKKILGQNEEWEPHGPAPVVQPWGLGPGVTAVVSANCLTLP